MVIKTALDAGAAARKAATAAAKAAKPKASQVTSRAAAKPSAKTFTPKVRTPDAPFSPKPAGFDPATTPPADELLQVLDDLPRLGRNALAEPMARAAERGLAHRLSAAARLSEPELLSVSAEDAGKYVSILRMVGAPDVLGQVSGTEALLQRVVRLREGQLKALANGGRPANAAAALREVESLAVDLQMDLERVARHGFEPPNIDVQALTASAMRAALG